MTQVIADADKAVNETEHDIAVFFEIENERIKEAGKLALESLRSQKAELSAGRQDDETALLSLSIGIHLLSSGLTDILSDAVARWNMRAESVCRLLLNKVYGQLSEHPAASIRQRGRAYSLALLGLLINLKKRERETPCLQN